VRPPALADVRSVVLRKSPRCDRCRLPLRWCVCPAHRDVTCPLEIDVVTHHREWFRPSSTSHLIHRVVPASRHHLWRRERKLTVAEFRVPDREVWILHPQGASMPAGTTAAQAQVVLLDGSWRETSAMAQELSAQARVVSLPMVGESRYWLRAQADRHRFSTVEALLFLLGALGLSAAREEVGRQFELHVYANLRARGHKELAEEFLEMSPVPTAFPELLAQLNVSRPMGPQTGGCNGGAAV